MTNRIQAPLFAFLAAGALAACGGGGGGGGSSQVPGPTPGSSQVPGPTPTPTPSPTPGPSNCTSASAGRAGDITTRMASRTSGGVVPDQLYVRYRTSSTTRSVQSIDKAISAVRAVDVASVGSDGLRAIWLPAGTSAAAATATLKQNPDVIEVSPVHYRSLASDVTAGANDFYFENTDQWYLYKTNVVKNPPANNGAWNLTTGIPSVSVAIIDTGVDLNGGSPQRPLGGHDFVVDKAESVLNGVRAVSLAAAQDTNGHGTNTAGLAVAQANNGYGFAGVGYSIHLQAYKIFPDATATSDCQTASTADESIAINDAVANGASVISMSLGSPQSQGSDPGEAAAVANAIAHNVVVVAANGNEFPTSDGQQSDFPAAYPGVIAVGASSVVDTVPNQYASITSETVSSFSNSGPTLVAPGGDPATNSDSDTLHWIEGYSTTTAAFPGDQCSDSNLSGANVCRVLFAGTSQATPQVAGVVALMKAFHAGGPATLTPAAVKAIFTSGAGVDVLPGIPSARQGAGRLNGGKAVAAAH